ncbi:MAG: metallophosphoesterase [Methylacidiphilales bacterium]|nr:metallophosphoesterase [Candidatus Methylacidiphilales bacterium]
MRVFILAILLYFPFVNLLACFLTLSVLRRLSLLTPQVRIGLWIWFVAVIGFLALQLGAPPGWRPFLQHWFYAEFAIGMFWNLILMPPIAVIALLAWLALKIRDFCREKSGRAACDKAALSEGITRRKFLYYATFGAAPAAALGAGVHGTITRNDLRVRELKIPVPGLPAAMEGFTITHMSDLHSGLFCGPEKLRVISDTANELKSDLVVVTGDLINDSVTELPAAMACIKRVESRYGIFICEGNHDYFAGQGALPGACAKAGLPYLHNSNKVLQIRGCNLYMAGLPWFGSHYRREEVRMDRLFPAVREKTDVRILLAHHPHLFDSALGSADLVLSGHTHGGQLMFGNVGCGPLFFRYWSGLYQKERSSLVVSNGCGDWFPCRIGAPAELLRLTLTSAG